MSYDLSLDKKAITLLVAGTALAGILVFIAGLIIGTQWNKTPAEATVASAPTRQPVLASQTEQPNLSKRPAADEEELSEGAADAPAETTGAAKPAQVNPPVGASRAGLPDVPGLNMPGLSAPGALEADPKVVQRAKPEAMADAGPDEGLAGRRESFSVQVGVFLEELDAERLIQELEGKGYTPNIFVANDADDRPWYAVRLGTYTDQAEAAQAASNFSKQEKMKAVVRPAGSL
jgi:septal ring-binding cell division protein DamX